VNGNSAAFESVTLATGTAVLPVFDNVMTIGDAEVRPTPVVAKTRPGHVMTNGDGVRVDGVVDVVLEQLTANAARMKTDLFANTAVVDCRNSRARQL